MNTLQMFLSAKIKDLGKSLQWFHYAQKNTIGFSMEPKKDEQYQLLEEITEEAHKQFPSYTKGEIADELFKMVH